MEVVFADAERVGHDVGIANGDELVFQTHARLDGEIAELVLKREEDLVLERRCTGVVAAHRVVHPLIAAQRIHACVVLAAFHRAVVADRNLTVLRIGAVVGQLGGQIEGAGIVLRVAGAGIFRRGEESLLEHTVGAPSPETAVQIHREIMAFVVELVLVVRAYPTPAAAVAAVGFLLVVGCVGKEKELLELFSIAFAIAPVRPEAAPKGEGVHRVDLIIEAEMDARTITVALGVSRIPLETHRFPVVTHYSGAENGHVGHAVVLVQRIGEVAIDVDGDLLVAPDV